MFIAHIIYPGYDVSMLLDQPTKQRIRSLRAGGHTYTEINQLLSSNIPKSTLSSICKSIQLSDDAQKSILQKSTAIRRRNQLRAVASNRQRHDAMLINLYKQNEHIRQLVELYDVKKIALAMLYLGEGAKWKSRRGPLLASSDPAIIKLYLSLIADCYGIERTQVRARIQHRADQDPKKLIKFWSNTVNIPVSRFYPSYMDKRSVGRVTQRAGYMGVCTITHPGTHIQLELQQITVIISEAMGC